MTAHLFRPARIRDCELKNRIVMSSMSQYCGEEDGSATTWHHLHWATRAVGGVGLVMSEATAIDAEGKLTPRDLSLFSKRHVETFSTGVDLVHQMGARFGIQLGHCGRKAYGRTKGESQERLISCSPLAFDEGWREPESLDVGEINDLTDRFVASARLAVETGADLVEIHAAHGYLLHQFLSPLSNQRSDGYGGNIEGRARFVCEVVSAVRTALPPGMPLFVRLSCTDWAEPEGFCIADAVIVSGYLATAGADLIDCSSGGTLPITHPPLAQGYQLPFSHEIRRVTNLPTGGVGLLVDSAYCEQALVDEKCDLVFLGRELLRNPYWALSAARELECQDLVPAQYGRAY